MLKTFIEKGTYSPNDRIHVITNACRPPASNEKTAGLRGVANNFYEQLNQPEDVGVPSLAEADTEEVEVDVPVKRQRRE